MPGDDLQERIHSKEDYYALLGVTFESSEWDIRRAYRRTALKYHPDKNADNPDAVEKFHLLQIAYDVLNDPAAKAAYDAERARRKAREAEREKVEGKRRKMMEELERRERRVSGMGAGAKREWDGDDEESEQLERERKIQRLAEEGRRRRIERQEKLNSARLEEEDRLGREAKGEVHSPPHGADERRDKPLGGTNVPEMERSIKVKWVKGQDEEIGKKELEKLFTEFGRVENVVILSDKKQRIDGKKKKIGIGVIVFSSIVGAHAAVVDAKTGPDWEIFVSIAYAANKDPGAETTRQPTPTPAAEVAATDPTPSTPASKVKSRPFPGVSSTPATPIPDGLKRVPSFASFSGSPFRKPLGSQSPSLEEITMIRLKNAERKRLEEQIRKQEEHASRTGQA